jgi:hypothetical protein
MAMLNMPLDEELHRRLRIVCAKKGVTQLAFVTDAIRTAVEASLTPLLQRGAVA